MENNNGALPRLVSFLCTLCQQFGHNHQVELEMEKTDAAFLRTLSLSEKIWGNDDPESRFRGLVAQIASEHLASAPDAAQIKELELEFGAVEQKFLGTEARNPRCCEYWPEFLGLIQECLMHLKKKFCQGSDDARMENSLQFLDFVTSIPLLLEDPGFMAYALRVVARVAIRSCCCWFLAADSVKANGMITSFLDLEDEIDLASRQFFVLSLNSLRAAYDPATIPEPESESKRLPHIFLRYVLKSADSSDGLFNELLPLVSLALKKEAGFLGECLQGDIADFLFGVAKGIRKEPANASLCSEFPENARLLKFEVLLKFLYESGSPYVPELNAIVENFLKISEKFGNQVQAIKLVGGVAQPQDILLLYATLGAEDATELSVRALGLLVILLKIVLFKAKSFRMDLSGEISLDTLEEDEVDDQIMNFEEGLQHFKAIEANLDLSNNVFSILEYAKQVCRSITSSSYTYAATDNREEVVTNMKNLFHDYMLRMNSILSEMIPIFPTSNVPKINVLRLANRLLEKLQGDCLLEKLQVDRRSLSVMKHFIKEIQETLPSWIPFLTEDADHEDVLTEATLVVYKVDYVVDLIEIDGVWKHAWWLYNLIQEMKRIDWQGRANQEINPSYHNVYNAASVISHVNQTVKEMEVLSRQKQEKDIISELERGSSSRYIISIVGMPGIGKTSLAKKVYHDPNVAAHFRRRAWCSVSQIYGKRNILLEISKEIDELDVSGDLEQNLFQLLKRCRCLIILDDLWDVEALNGLSTQFDDNREGSKILITTRFHRMALEARPSGHYPFSLHPLQEEESWDLLKMKLFRGEGSMGCCPNELVEIGKKIARACQGLPLSVVAIAGILERTEKTVDCWNKIAQNLNSSIIDDPQSQCKGIIELSYMFLPLHLRECFLYLGAFLEGRDVSASKLIRLWIVEGFIEKSDPEKSLEDTAEGYLMDLIDRSLVMISRTKFNGMVKSCSIHDLLREFCLLKAKAGKFFQLVTMHDQPYAKYNGVDYGDELIEHCKSNPVFYEGCRVSVQIKGKHFFDSSPSGQCTHTLMLSPTSDSAHYDISLIPERFRLLTVLNLERISISSGFPRDIEVLVFLRYLVVSGNVNSIPESIGKLWRLETFIVRGTSDKIVIPSSIWGLVKLRHLHVKNCATLNQEDSLSVSDYVLHDLVSFSSPALLGDLENIPRRVPNLRKLSCIFLKSSTQFPELESLTRLESLRIMYSGSAPTYSDFNLPKSLKKLTLSNFGLPWQQIDTIARLPNLQVLKLVCGAFKGEKWDMVEDKFPKLEFLMLDSLNFSQWVGPYDNLTELKKLVVKNCKELEKIPLDFSYIESLETIEVHNCKESVKLSAKHIGEKFDARVITSEM